MKASESITQLAGALALAAGAFEPIVRDKHVTVRKKAGGEYQFAYAPLESVVQSVRPALAANGLVLLQSVVPGEKCDFIETRVMHASGEFISNDTAVLVMEDGPQAYGSAITYARRYGITTLLCLVADEDDDGNVAEGNVATQRAKRSAGAPLPPPAVVAITADQHIALRDALAEVKGDAVAFAKFMGVGHLDQLPASKYAAAMAAVAAKRRRLEEAAAIADAEVAKGAQS
jgi:hypothetical protein